MHFLEVRISGLRGSRFEIGQGCCLPGINEFPRRMHQTLQCSADPSANVTSSTSIPTTAEQEDLPKQTTVGPSWLLAESYIDECNPRSKDNEACK